MKNFFCTAVFALTLLGLEASAEVYDSAILAGLSPDVSTNAVIQTLSSKGFKVRNSFNELNVIILEPKNANSDPNIAIATVAATPGITYAEPNTTIKLLRTPNDSNRTNFNSMKLETAWDVTIGSHDVIVADSDTGVDINHKDLQNNIWTNRGEIPNNNIDDDKNGFADDVHGWNFANNSNNPDDDYGHGSHVAGIMGAEGDNKIGLAGVNWKISIMPLKFITAKGEGSLENGIATILYAANNGARILNASWGETQYSQALADAITYASKKNLLVIAAAGNYKHNADQIPLYPAAYRLPNIVSVAAYDGQHNLAWFSNFGPQTVHIAGPGVDVYSCNKNGGYTVMSGTSMATPAAAGVAALMLSVRPDLSLNDLRNALFNGTTAFKPSQTAAGGRVNATIAIKQLLDPTVQVWPRHMRVKKGSTFQFTGFNTRSSNWRVANPELGSIDSAGVFTAKAKGESFVELVDTDGRVYRNQQLKVSE